MFREFKQFVMRGNVVELATAVILGIAFGAVVTSFVNDVLMPPLGLLLGKVNFADLFINLSGKDYATLADAQKAGAPTINYGLFINSIINFVIVAFSIFLVIRTVNRGMLTATKKCPFCTSSIPSPAKRCPQCTSELDNSN